MVYVLAGVGVCALIFGAFFIWWFCDCFVSSETVIVEDHGHSDVIVEVGAPSVEVEIHEEHIIEEY